MNHFHLGEIGYHMANEGDKVAVPAIALHDWRDQNLSKTKLHRYGIQSQMEKPITI